MGETGTDKPLKSVINIVAANSTLIAKLLRLQKAGVDTPYWLLLWQVVLPTQNLSNFSHAWQHILLNQYNGKYKPFKRLK
jgi:hypothetical protein